MKSSTLRTFISVHTWVGLVAGFCLFIAFYAGAVTIFHEELLTWETASSRAKPVESTARVQELIDAVLKAHPQAKQSVFLHLPSRHAPNLSLDWDEELKDGGEIEHHFRLNEAGQLEDVKPYSQMVDFIYRLHYSAGFPLSWGIYVLGVICLLYGLALASGVIIYAPLFLKDLFALRIGKNIKRMWQDAHNAVGILSLPFHLMYAWSSAILTLGVILMAPFQYLVFDGKLLNFVGPDISAAAPPTASGVAATTLPASALLAAIQRAAPGMQVETMAYHQLGDANAQVQAYGKIHQHTVSSTAAVVLSASSGGVVRVVTPAQYSPGTRFLRSLQALHFGNFGHAAVKWTYFILGMSGAFLFYSGNLLWVEARRKRQQLVQPRSGRLMAQATLGVCLGCVAGVSAVFVLSKLAPGELPLWEQRGYYAVFFACVAWAFARPPARAAHELLMLCAALTAAIPLAQWYRSGSNPLQSLMRGDGVIVGVALVAIVFAALYWKMARAVLHRGRHGDPHSVWSLRAISAVEAGQRREAA
ncbi:PepSY-associated TM helix domain-containing protein [Rugamonas sp. CCM 8940]|uniref:PepSY-associated TM helix domain-containing protein n=1 Tax=Rugamonas sp. CCM 8940 TaxID=2765359 RepID=UPI0018F455A3|nr:PepSY-associated TM helix domain-containing protein [Rugamonas sp. CCM 8940]MBJ7312532.1 PepSY domain-containing protein [Rugamonas sp. CCM 8940]